MDAAWQKYMPLGVDMLSHILISFLLMAMQMTCWSLLLTFSQLSVWAWLSSGVSQARQRSV